MKNWELVFKSFANINRLKILQMLTSNKSGMNVSEISKKLEISFRATSRHLIYLKNVRILDSIGREGHLVYILNSNMPSNFQKILKQFL